MNVAYCIVHVLYMLHNGRRTVETAFGFPRLDLAISGTMYSKADLKRRILPIKECILLCVACLASELLFHFKMLPT